MSFANIIEVSLSPIPVEDRIDNATIEMDHGWFIGSVAEYISDTPLDRHDTLKEMAFIARTSDHRSYEIGEDGNGQYILVKSKENYFRPMWECFKKKMESTISLEKFMSYRGEDDKFANYIYADGELMVFPDFIRECVVGEPYYIGGIVGYHS